MIRLIAVGLAAVALAGCGVRGELERPPPLWGEDLRTPEERAHETEGGADRGIEADNAAAEDDGPAR